MENEVDVVLVDEYVNEETGETFPILHLEQDVIRVSKKGNTYQDSRKTTMTSTLSLEKAKRKYEGKSLKGNIELKECAKYSWLNPSTNQKEERTTTWKFVKAI